MMYILGAKFEEHCLNISRDILDSVFYCFSKTIYVIAFLSIIQKQNVSISKKKEKDPKRKMQFFILKRE